MTQRQHGVVVTHVEHLGQLADCLRRGGYDTVKVVTKFGIDGGWNAENMRELLRMVPHVIVRTVNGDPSFRKPDADFRFPFANQVIDELKDWYDIRHEIMFEIGNEPNVDAPDDDFIFKYQAHLALAIKECRDNFKEAKLISPALILAPDKRFERFNELCVGAFRSCDFIGLHFYEDFGFMKAQQPSTTDLLSRAIRLAQQFYGDKDWYVTEYGINDAGLTMSQKGRRYAGMAYYRESDPPLPDNVAGLTYYHLSVRPEFDANYHIFPDGDTAFGNRLRANPPRGLAPEAMVAPLRFVVVDPCSSNPANNFASVRQAPKLDAIEAGQLPPGTPVLIDVIADGWAHLAKANRFHDLGFVPLSLLRQDT